MNCGLDLNLKPVRCRKDSRDLSLTSVLDPSWLDLLRPPGLCCEVPVEMSMVRQDSCSVTAQGIQFQANSCLQLGVGCWQQLATCGG